MSPVHDDVRFEKSDASVPGILAFALGLVVLVSASQLGLAWWFGRLAETARARTPPLSVLVEKERAVLPQDLGRIPDPRLEESEGEALRALHQEEDIRLHGYGWVDRKGGVLRIPIGKAIELLSEPTSAAARGVRVRPK